MAEKEATVTLPTLIDLLQDRKNLSLKNTIFRIQSRFGEKTAVLRKIPQRSDSCLVADIYNEKPQEIILHMVIDPNSSRVFLPFKKTKL